MNYWTCCSSRLIVLQHVCGNIMGGKLLFSFGREGCHVLVQHVAFVTTQWCPAMYQLFNTGVSPGLCSSHSQILALVFSPNQLVKSKPKSRWGTSLTETGIAGHMSLQVLQTPGFVWKFYLLVTVNKT